MPEILDRLRQNAHKDYVRRRYRETTREVCHCCGIMLESWHDEPLSTYFVMDIQGNFYCIECDAIFEVGDERIYHEEEE